MPLLQIVQDVFEFCVASDPRSTGGIGGDNMTCLIIRLNLETSTSSTAAGETEMAETGK
jgi:hypothetical protein